MALKPNALGPPLARIAVVGQDTGSAEFAEAPRGSRFVFTTSPSRSSATLTDTVGYTYGWISKETLLRCPEGNKLLTLLHAGKLVAVKFSPDTVELFSTAAGVAPRFEDPDDAETDKQRRIQAPIGTLINNTPTYSIAHKENNTMNNFISRLIATNKNAAADAAVLEAGRIANNTVVKIIISRMPFLARFTGAKYFQGPAGKLIVANGALMLAQQLRPDDKRVRSLTEAMATQAYQELYQQVDIEGMIDQLLDLPEIKRALKKLDADAPKTGFAAAAPAVE